jgi:hypothetical protein
MGMWVDTDTAVKGGKVHTGLDGVCAIPRKMGNGVMAFRRVFTWGMRVRCSLI